MEHEEFAEFFSCYKDKWLGCTMAEAKDGITNLASPESADGETFNEPPSTCRRLQDP